jgi:translocation and assembly module TamB
MQGNVKNLSDPDKMSMQVSLNRFYTTSKDIYTVLADSFIPTSIQLPDSIELNGNFKGLVKAPAFSALLNHKLQEM